MALRELTDGQDVDVVALVRQREARSRRDGTEYLRLVLADRTGQVQAVVYEGIVDCAPHCVKGTPVRVSGRYSVDARHGAQVVVQALRPAEPGEFDLDDLVDGPPRSATQMEADLR